MKAHSMWSIERRQVEAKLSEHTWMDALDCEHYAPTPGLDLVRGVLSDAVGCWKKQGQRCSSR